MQTIRRALTRRASETISGAHLSRVATVSVPTGYCGRGGGALTLSASSAGAFTLRSSNGRSFDVVDERKLVHAERTASEAASSLRKPHQACGSLFKVAASTAGQDYLVLNCRKESCMEDRRSSPEMRGSRARGWTADRELGRLKT